MSLVLSLRPDLDSYTERVSLDGVDYDLAFIWNERDSQYYFSIFAPDSPVLSDGSRVAIVAGLPVVVNTFLLQDLPGRERPPGDFLAIDSSGQGEEAGRRDLGARVTLLYVTLAEFLEAAGV